MRSWLLLFFLASFSFSKSLQAGFMVEAHNNLLGNLVVQLFDEDKKHWVTQHFWGEVELIGDAYSSIKSAFTLHTDHLSSSYVHNIYCFDDHMFYAVFNKKLHRHVVFEHPTSAFCHSTETSCAPIHLKATVLPYIDPQYHRKQPIKIAYNTDKHSFLAMGPFNYYANPTHKIYEPVLFRRESKDTGWVQLDNLQLKSANVIHDIHYHQKFLVLGEDVQQDEDGNISKSALKLFNSQSKLDDKWHLELFYNDDPVNEDIPLYTAAVLDNTLVYFGADPLYANDRTTEIQLLWSQKKENARKKWTSTSIPARINTFFWDAPSAYITDLILSDGDKVFTIVKTGKRHKVAYFTRDSTRIEKMLPIPTLKQGSCRLEDQLRPYKLFGALEHNFLLYNNNLFKITSKNTLEHYASFPNASQRDVIWIHD